MEKKICKKCKEEKELTNEFFSKSKKYWQHTCRECLKEQCRLYKLNNKEKISEINKKIYYENLEANQKRSRVYQKENCHKRNYKKEYLRKKERRIKDSLYDFKIRLRRRTYKAFRSSYWQKKDSFKHLLGCEYKMAFNHIESQFKDGMSWDNRSKWHIDHIIPLASANTEEELMKLCHYTNLQPLWAKDNLKKGSTYNEKAMDIQNNLKIIAK